MAIRLLILDVEGVIAPSGGSQYPWELDALIEVRRLLAEAPPACVLCSGRQVPYGEAVIQALDLLRPFPPERRQDRMPDALGWPSILENGATFYDPLAKRLLPNPDLDPRQATRLRSLRDGPLAELVARIGATVEIGKEFCISLNPPPVAPGSPLRGSTADLLPLVVSALGAAGDEVEVKASASSVDITPRGASKATAVRRLLEWSGLQREEVLGVGDTPADAAWLAEVGWRAAPANGREALRDLHFVAPSPSAAGLGEILRRLRDGGYRGL